ncbi:hypothetical protein [Nocardia wallacei]|uniref:hypothetical protein n=1 Tax=Nocardia wallacei TaxID=480035 RepID=UPI0024540C8C|nr:hypothetical protein [Nocardia wallacei]
MATFTGKFYGLFWKSALNKEIDIDSDNIKIMLLDDTYTFAQDTHQYKSSITGEVSGTGYAAGGQTLTGVSVTYDAATNTIKLAAANPSWATSTITDVDQAVIYDATPGTDATRPLIAHLQSDSPLSSNNGTLSIAFDPGGIATLNVAA